MEKRTKRITCSNCGGRGRLGGNAQACHACDGRGTVIVEDQS